MSDTTTLIFEEPPATKAGSRETASPVALWLHALREYPGRTARYPTAVSAPTATSIRKGRYSGIEEGEFTVVTRKADGEDSKVNLWVTYKN